MVGFYSQVKDQIIYKQRNPDFQALLVQWLQKKQPQPSLRNEIDQPGKISVRIQ